MSELNVAIVGAGIGGLTAAIAMHRNGIDVTVYEKAYELGELGAGVVVGANGARVFERLGLADSLAKIAGRGKTFTIKTWKGVPLPGYRPPYDAEQAYPLHRAEFQRLLSEALPPGTVQLGRACTAPSRTMTAHGSTSPMAHMPGPTY